MVYNITMSEETKTIKEKLSQAHTLLENEYIKIVEEVQEEVQKLVDKANEYTKKIAILKGDWQRIETEVKSLEGRQTVLKEKENEVEEKMKEVVVREDQVAAMMKIQTNRQNILDEKEKALKEKERRQSIYPAES